MNIKLSSLERLLLKELSEEGEHLYADYCGRTLDSLIRKRLAKLYNGREFLTAFVEKGKTLIYSAVSLTDAGRAELQRSGGQ